MITFYFHVSKNSRIKYEFEESIFSVTGDLIITDAKTARSLTEKINKKRRDEGRYDQLVTVGQLNALGLMHEIFHLLIRKYEETDNPGVFERNLEFLDRSLSNDEVDKILLSFIDEFPPIPVFKNQIKADDYLKGKTGSKSNREIILEELILLNLENINPSTNLLKELYSDEKLAKTTKYAKLVESTEKFFEKEIPVGRKGFSLISFLRRPITSSPYNIHEQLEFIRTNWVDVLDEDLLEKLLRGKDLIQEDFKLFIQHGGGEKGTPPVPSYEFDHAYFESLKKKLEEGKKLTDSEYQYYQLELERFTEDTDWMPKVVMIAKNAYVWLFQLSKKYAREIRRLDQIPDEELDQLARWNFTSLWLIGIWERSTASKKIKQMMGNPEAASSAYSLYDYVIAKDLGGENAFNDLKDRAWQRGIRLASDMVPNHTGIYSKWVVEKPDYFLQSSIPPYPGYRFTGPNLSDDERVEVRIEDQYYSRTDAAVVFERLDRYTGDRKYIYHGNDGTNMPWNDTAQLNLMLPEVRESLIQTIMHVARKTPIIRFDAAMTLAKKHYQRLWFPIPGSGGAIPSRSDYAMTRSQFDEQMPQEFWREVVDRINSEMPNTLLLAEAFWLMEGYFVRTLGMHRVYNSAFMHMLMKEENEKYKLLIKNTLTFNPEILKRYVNFMSNPDEETAVNQFGKGDKYFGVATLMVTLPGLPMFAHGQIEGFSEKYGMEYQKAYYNEIPDDHLIWRHQKEIFPLMRKRHLFSQVEYFELYDFISPAGDINENVFAYSNKSGNEFALVLYNNSYAEAFGSIRYSSDKIQKDNSLNNTTIANALSLNVANQFFYSYCDYSTNLYHLLSGNEIHYNGFNLHLRGYQVKVLLDFKEIYDYNGQYKRLYEYLGGRGVESLDKALVELNLTPYHNSLINLFSTPNLEYIKKIFTSVNEKVDKKLINQIEDVCKNLDSLLSTSSDSREITRNTEIKINALLSYYNFSQKISSAKRKEKWFADFTTISPFSSETDENSEVNFLIILKILESILAPQLKTTSSSIIFQDLMLWKPFFEIFSYVGLNNSSEIYYNLLIILCEIETIPAEVKQSVNSKKNNNNILTIEKYIVNLFNNESTKIFLLVNEYDGNIFFNKERFYILIKWLTIKSTLHTLQTESGKKAKDLIKNLSELFSDIIKKSSLSGYQVKEFINLISKSKKSKSKIKPERYNDKAK